MTPEEKARVEVMGHNTCTEPHLNACNERTRCEDRLYMLALIRRLDARVAKLEAAGAGLFSATFLSEDCQEDIDLAREAWNSLSTKTEGGENE